MAETITIPCPHCDKLNRMPAERRGRGKCGSCHRALFTGRPMALTAARFDRHANAADLPLLVDFWAEWCGPCKAMAPVFEQAAAELEPKLRLAKVDADAEPALAARHRVQAIPTLILFKGGREVARQAGALPGGNLKRWVEQYVA